MVDDGGRDRRKEHDMISKVMELAKSAAGSEGIRITPQQYETAKNIQTGAEALLEISGEVLEQMAPTDDTPYLFTWGEGFAMFTERLGAKLSGK